LLWKVLVSPSIRKDSFVGRIVSVDTCSLSGPRYKSLHDLLVFSLS
jgi:hypothetical protein